MKPPPALVLAVLALVWGASFLFIRILVTAGVEPVGVSAGRTVLGLVTLLPFAFSARRTFRLRGRQWAALVVLGVTNFALPWTLFSIGQQYVPSGVGSIANAAQPIWAAIFVAAVMRTERLGPRRVAGLVLGFAGVLVLMEGRVGELDAEAWRGIPLMVLATVLYAASSVSIRRWLADVPPLVLTVGQVGTASLVLAPLALGTGAYAGASFGWQEWASLLVLGGVGSGVAIVLYMWLLHELGAVAASAVTYLMPPIGIFLGWLLLDEAVRWPMLAGLALIIAGVGLVQRIALRRPARAVLAAITP
ncbi:MAG: DMT family transporter [Dehalococcoidia bacterium]|nr:DMT family transporter [Dehalococcoidia bacterium]